jgi:hypothetical protein
LVVIANGSPAGGAAWVILAFSFGTAGFAPLEKQGSFRMDRIDCLRSLGCLLQLLLSLYWLGSIRAHRVV